ncbi:MAG: AraC family transcriptional regulator [Treponema sp.]|jgi:AraC-like DNA-binding protein|nr:AraC family transcriptional regulator [Treponema sp.]
MKEKPWHWKSKLDPSFPFYLWDAVWDSPEITFPFHWHKEIEIVYLIKGRLVIYINGQAYDVHPGDIVIINSDLIHGYQNKSPDTHYIEFIFFLEIFDQLLPDIQDSLNQMVVFGRKTIFRYQDDWDLHYRMANIILSIWEEYNTRQDGYRLAIKKNLYDFALIFLRRMPQQPLVPKQASQFNAPAFERILSYIYENYDNSVITLEKAAEVACLSKFYFSRFFRERTGQTFHAYLSRIRINRAQEYLSETDMTITDIAFNCGFASLKTFNRLFRSYTGVSPSLYRCGAKCLIIK